MEIKIIKASSVEYEQIIALRITALLKPIGVPPSYINRKKEENDIFIGAFKNNEIAGCCVLTKADNEVLQLRQMAVRPNLQGNKIGTAIIEFAEKTAKENNYKVLMMHARDPVIGFYKKCGYQLIGEQFFEVGIGHHKMQKQL